MDLRWPFGGIWVLLLLAFLGTFGRVIQFHLLLIPSLVILGHVLEFDSLLGRHGLHTKEKMTHCIALAANHDPKLKEMFKISKV